MFRTALRNVFAHKARLLMTVLAVMLGVAFVSGTLVFTNTISSALEKSSSKGFDQVDVAVTPGWKDGTDDKVGEEIKLTDATLKKAQDVPGAASATGVLSGYAAVADQDGKLVGNGFSTQGGNYWGDKDARYPLNSSAARQGADQVAIDGTGAGLTEQQARAGIAKYEEMASQMVAGESRVRHPKLRELKMAFIVLGDGTLFIYHRDTSLIKAH